ncbi:histidine phosphatase family protein [Legionella sp. CNM-4043-24]|uniref:histidine phosphatase family protein n=1 Tax=Legionella sp. CNM-4043-24 TaxID=3421646 RepID=UPI00403B0E26
MKKYCFLAVALWAGQSLATPSEIIVVRHGDKPLEPAAKWADVSHPSLSLNAKGTVRSVVMARYILSKFGKPDYVFATAAANDRHEELSVRNIQTAGPLTTMLAEDNPEGYKMYFPYTATEYARLSKDLLSDSRYDNKKIVIVWNHHHIPALLNALGIKDKIPVWPQNNFDTVYVLDYAKNGQLSSWKRLDNQYPVSDKVTWESLAALANG